MCNWKVRTYSIIGLIQASDSVFLKWHSKIKETCKKDNLTSAPPPFPGHGSKSATSSGPPCPKGASAESWLLLQLASAAPCPPALLQHGQTQTASDLGKGMDITSSRSSSSSGSGRGTVAVAVVVWTNP